MNIIIDLFEENGNIILFTVWQDRGVPKNHYIQWRGVITAIPTAWRLLLKQGFKRDKFKKQGFMVSEDDKVLEITILNTKACYNIFVDRIREKPTSQIKHSVDFEVNDDEWENMYNLPFKCCKDTKLQMFQYKINLNCCMTNSRLYKMRIVESSLCNLCHSGIETLKHLYCECEVSKTLWLDFAQWWENHMNQNFVRDPKSIMFGIEPDNPNLLLNLCIIIIKRVIYLCRFKGVRPHMNHFKSILKINFYAEKNIAIENNTMYKFLEKWNHINEEMIC